MKIVHAPTEIAWQMSGLCLGLREAGMEVNGYNWFHTFINYKKSVVDTDAYELASCIDPLLEYCDLFHFHNGNTFMVDHADLPYIAQLGKKIIMHHWGNDVRTVHRTSQLNPYSLPPSYFTDDEIHSRLLKLTRYISHAIIQDYELYPHIKDYYEHVHVLPLVCAVDAFQPQYPEMKATRIRIVHAPTNRAFKGSDDIERVIRDLQASYPIDFILIEGKSHAEALQLYASADIVIDQIRCGSHGMLSVEAMAMGKPVIAYIRDDIKQQMPHTLPIINANPDSLKEVLTSIMQSPEILAGIGRASREYAVKEHSIPSVTRRLLEIYAMMK